MKNARNFGILIAIIAMVACTPEIKFDIDNFSIRNTGSSEMSVSSKGDISVVVGAEGGSSLVQFTTNKAWTIEAINARADSWCSVTPAGGNMGTVSLTVNTRANDSYDERNASFSLKCEDRTFCIVIKQKQRDAVIVSSDKVEIGAEGGIVQIEVKHNINFSYEISASAKTWIKDASTKGLSLESVSFAIEPNDGIGSRNGSIAFTSSEGSEIVNIFQEGYEPTIVLTQKEYIVSSDGGPIAIEVRSNIDVDCSIDSGTGWIQEDITKSMSSNTYRFHIQQNDSYDQRTGVISFKDQDSDLAESVSIIQMQNDAIVLAKNEYEFGMESQTLDIMVLANVDVQINCSDWIREVTTKGLTEHNLSFLILENTTGDLREGYIKFTSGNIEQSVKITQYYAFKNGILEQLEEYTDLPRESITGINFFTESDKVTDRYTITDGCYPIYGETVGSMLNFYTKGNKFRLQNNTWDMPDGGFRYGFFSWCTSLAGIDMSSLDTGECADFSGLFAYCYSLSSINFSGIETSNVRNMGGMFEDCRSLKELNLSNFDTSNVVSMGSMFHNCSSLEELDISRFNTSLVRDFSYMFANCKSIIELNVSDFDTSNAERMFCMFQDCSSLKELDMSKFNTSHVSDFSFMFANCSSIIELNVSDFNTSNAEDISRMFSNCSAIERLDVRNFDTSNVSNMAGLFQFCSSIREINLSNFDTSHVLDMSCMFSNCSAIERLDLRNFDTSNVSNMAGLFQCCYSIREINLSNFDTSNVVDMSGVFFDCGSLEKIDISNFDTSNVQDMRVMFAGCSSLKSLELSHFNTSKVENMNWMFGNCNYLEYLNLSQFDTSSVKDMYGMFWECNSLKSIDVSSFDTSNVVDMSFMFGGALHEMIFDSLDVSSFDTSNVQDMTAMFQCCTKLSNLNLSNFNTSKVRSVKTMFSNCVNLESLDLSNFDLSSVQSYWAMLSETGKDAGVCKIKCGSATKKALITNDTYWDAYPPVVISWDLTDDESVYESSDYSQDGIVKKLKCATVGDGVNIVMMGDAYSDRLIADGTYEADIYKAMDALFSIEPYKSLESLFNVYEVKAVSANEEYGGITAFSGRFGSGTEASGDNAKVMEYAIKAVGEDMMDKTTVAVLMNAHRYAGTDYMYGPSTGNSEYGDGLSIAFVPLCTSDGEFAGTFRHEVGGHGFAKLADEYAYEYMGAIPPEIVASYVENANAFNWYKNIDFTSDESYVKWSRFLSDNRYTSEGLGVFEGGCTYWSGVWRPAENSIMRYNDMGFNAPSREAIYMRASKLAFGDSWQYDYEEFVSQDVKSRSSKQRNTAGWDVSIHPEFKPTAAPVVIQGGWKKAMLEGQKARQQETKPRIITSRELSTQAKVHCGHNIMTAEFPNNISK